MVPRKTLCIALTIWCAWWDLNPYALANTSTSSSPVCLFQHTRINHLLCLLFKVVSHKATYQKHRHGVRVSPVGGSLVRIHVYDFGVLGESRTRKNVGLNHARLPIAPREHKRATICFRTTRCSMGQPLILFRSWRIESLGLKSRRTLSNIDSGWKGGTWTHDISLNRRALWPTELPTNIFQGGCR